MVSGFEPTTEMTPPRSAKSKMDDGPRGLLFQDISGIRPRFDPESESSNGYKQTVNESQYSTNNTQTKDQVIEEPVRDMPLDAFAFTRQLPSGLRSPMNGPRENQEAFTKSPLRAVIPSRSPIRSPISNKTGCNLVSDFSHLEQYGITVEDFRTEKAVTNEMLRMARNQIEITKLLKNSLILLRKESSGSSTMIQQMNLKVNALKSEVQESKKKLFEICNVTV